MNRRTFTKLSALGMSTSILSGVLPTTGEAQALGVSVELGESEKLSKPASAVTTEHFKSLTASLPFDDKEDFELASRGLLATVPGGKIVDASGRLVRDLNAMDAFFSQPAPATVNPSLWRSAQLLSKAGLFKVTDRIYQVRGIDVSNTSIIVGDTGYIVIDTLATIETAKAAMDLVRQKLGERPITGIIYTDSHGDHYGGAGGVISRAEATSRRIPIVAPQGFAQALISESAISGPAGARRITYGYGLPLPLAATGIVSDGDGPSVVYRGIFPGTPSLIPPTKEITHTGEAITIDGVEFQFQLTPDTEAPADMNVFLPGLQALCVAENANDTMHNIQTLRGAPVRDAKAWTNALTEVIRLFGNNTETMFGTHSFPRWGKEKIIDYLQDHRDAYAFLHDQSVRMMNNGLVGSEIADQITLPGALAKRWFNRGYYGTMSHNAKGIYSRYMGWFDGNPANLDSLPPEDAGKRYVEAMGGATSVLRLARAAFDKGEYRWASELLSRLVFAAPDNMQARSLLADSLEQQGYQAESASWRNFFLVGAFELRAGGAKGPAFDQAIPIIRSMPLSTILDVLAVRIDPGRALASPMQFEMSLRETGEKERVEIRNGVLIHQPASVAPGAAEKIVVDRSIFLSSIAKLPADDKTPVPHPTFVRFAQLFESPQQNFGVVLPRP